MTYVRDAACVRDYREKGAGKRDQENPLSHFNSLFHFISFHFIFIGLFRFTIFFSHRPQIAKALVKVGSVYIKQNTHSKWH